jgi:hypothetical protein
VILGLPRLNFVALVVASAIALFALAVFGRGQALGWALVPFDLGILAQLGVLCWGVASGKSASHLATKHSFSLWAALSYPFIVLGYTDIGWGAAILSAPLGYALTYLATSILLFLFRKTTGFFR